MGRRVVSYCGEEGVVSYCGEEGGSYCWEGGSYWGGGVFTVVRG